MPGLDRFKSAQASADSGFESALAEIRSGGKRTHWIWYVFPQLAGLGVSPASQRFAIADEAEAIEYLHDFELRSRLLTMMQAVAGRLNARHPASLRALMGSDTDARKLVSSLTLFGRVAKQLHAAEGEEVYQRIAAAADEVLSIAAAQGYSPCEYTLGQLR